LDNLVDLFHAIDSSKIDEDVQIFIKKMIAIQFEEKPLATMDRAIDESLGLMG
jgi:hypothetical protein